MENVTIIGIIAGVLTATSMLPQLVKIIQTKQVKDVSIGMLLLLFGGVATWVYYGILQDDWPIIITNSFSCLVNATTIYCKLRFKDSSTSA